MQLNSTLNLQQLQCMHSGSKAKVKVRDQVSHVHLVATSIKYGEHKARGEKCKKCGKIGHFTEVFRSKSVNNSQYRSNNQSARFSGSHDGEVLETMQRENIPWIDSIHIQSENTTIYSGRGYSKVHNVQKTRGHQAFTRVQLFPRNRMGKATGNKPKGMKCKLDTGTGVSIIPLSIYQYVNPFRVWWTT